MPMDMKIQTLNHVFIVFFILMLYFILMQALLNRNPRYCCHIGLSGAACLVSASEIFF